MKNALLVIGLFLLSTSIFSQKIAVDSKGKSVFSFYSFNDSRIEISSDEPLSISTSFYRFLHPFKIDTNRTVTKVSGWIATLSMLNSGDFPVYNNLNKLRPGVGLKLGYQVSVDKIHDLANTRGTYAWGINGIVNMDNIKLFNSADSTIGKAYPITYGFEANFTRFPASTNKFLIAANISLTKTWNDDDLLNYQNKADVTIRNTVVALEEFDGRYGLLDRNVTKFRFSTSMPLYLGRFNPIPYVALVSATGSMPKYFVGTFLNILNRRLADHDYTVPSSVGVGFDWTFSGDKKWSGINIFIKGSLNIGKFQ